MENTKASPYKFYILKSISIGLPIIILIIIFKQINLSYMIEVFRSVNLPFLMFGLLISPSVILTGAIRWKISLRYFIIKQISNRFIISHYWIGLTIGRFLPGAITWDIYRIAVFRQRYGKLGIQVYSLFLEKIAALLTASILVTALYGHVEPLIAPGVLIDKITIIIKENLKSISAFHYFLVSIILIFVICTGVLIGIKWVEKKNIDWYKTLVRPLISLRLGIMMILSSFGIYLFMAVFNHLFFYALNTPLPFIIHLFLMPVLAILMMLPISIGGLGVREGLFILFYGLFGIEMETALAAALMNLLVTLFYCAIGSIFILLKGIKPNPKNHGTFG